MLRQMKSMQQCGQVTLIFTLCLLLAAAYIAIFVAKSTIAQERIIANQYRSAQALQAAEAGLNFGIVYLMANKALIVVDANNNGFIDSFSNSSVTNVSLNNGSTFSITYTNPTASNFNVIRVTSVGFSADGTAKRTLSVSVAFSPLLFHISNSSMVVKGEVDMVGNSQVRNTVTNNNILSGGSIVFSGNGASVTSLGVTSDNSHLGSDVSQNNTAIANMSDASFFANFFGTTMNAVKGSVAQYYQNSGNTNYNSVLNGVTGTSVWLEQTGGGTATIDSGTVIGTAANPVLLIVNGNLTIAGNAIIYGYIYVTGNVLTAGNVSVIGALVTEGDIRDAGNYVLTYNVNVLNNLQQQSGSFAVIPGSWNDLTKG